MPPEHIKGTIRSILDEAEAKAKAFRQQEPGDWESDHFWNIEAIRQLHQTLLMHALDAAEVFEAEAVEGVAEDAPDRWLRKLILVSQDIADRGREILAGMY